MSTKLFSRCELLRHFDQSTDKQSDTCILLVDCVEKKTATKWEAIGQDIILYDGQNIQAFSQLLDGQRIELVFASFDPNQKESVIAFERTCFIAREMDIPIYSISTVKDYWVHRMAAYMGAMQHFEEMPMRSEVVRIALKHGLS